MTWCNERLKNPSFHIISYSPLKISSPHSTLQSLQLKQRRHMIQQSRVQNKKKGYIYIYIYIPNKLLNQGGILNSRGM